MSMAATENRTYRIDRIRFRPHFRPEPRYAMPAENDFRLDDTSSGDWAVFDYQETILYTGTLSACEEWLDQLENQLNPRSIFQILREMWQRA